MKYNLTPIQIHRSIFYFCRTLCPMLTLHIQIFSSQDNRPDQGWGACTISPSTRTLRYGPSCRCAAYVLPKRKKPIFNFGSLGSLRNHLRYRDSIICIYICTCLISYILGIKTYKIPPQKLFFVSIDSQNIRIQSCGNIEANHGIPVPQMVSQGAK